MYQLNKLKQYHTGINVHAMINGMEFKKLQWLVILSLTHPIFSDQPFQKLSIHFNFTLFLDDLPSSFSQEIQHELASSLDCSSHGFLVSVCVRMSLDRCCYTMCSLCVCPVGQWGVLPDTFL